MPVITVECSRITKETKKTTPTILAPVADH